MTTISDQIRGVIRERGRATTDEIVAALPHIERRKIVDALRLISGRREYGADNRLRANRTAGIVGTRDGWMLS